MKTPRSHSNASKTGDPSRTTGGRLKLVVADPVKDLASLSAHRTARARGFLENEPSIPKIIKLVKAVTDRNATALAACFTRTPPEQLAIWCAYLLAGNRGWERFRPPPTPTRDTAKRNPKQQSDYYRNENQRLRNDLSAALKQISKLRAQNWVLQQQNKQKI